MEVQKNRRRKYFIDKRVQGRVIGLVVFIIVIVALVTVIPTLISSMGTQGGSDVKGGINNLLFIGLLIVILTLILTAVYGTRFTHRIVGPIYAFNRHMNFIINGKYNLDLRLRKGDEFQALCKVFNNMQASLRRRSQKSIDTCLKAEKSLNDLKESLAKSGQDQAALDMLDGLIQEIEALRNENENYVSEK